MRRSHALAWFLAAAAVGLVTFALALSVLAGDHADPWWQNALGFGAVLGTMAIGLLIAVRREGHPIAWLLLGNAVIVGSFGVAGRTPSTPCWRIRARCLVLNGRCCGTSRPGLCSLA